MRAVANLRMNERECLPELADKLDKPRVAYYLQIGKSLLSYMSVPRSATSF